MPVEKSQQPKVKSQKFANQDDLQALRHSTAHLLAAAVLELYPEVKPTIGPSIENGFYYDFDFGDIKISETDFKKIEQKMHQLVKSWEGFEKEEVSGAEALARVAGNEYKQELVAELIKAAEPISFYKSGEFIDLCRGGHVDEPKLKIQHFKLLSVAGAYWRGSENNSMLTRIYGTAFETKEELEAYLTQLAEAKKRDHRKLGQELDLFTFSDLVGAGLPLWTPKGTLLRNLLDDYVWKLRQAKGYQKVSIPHITKRALYETSGHWAKYADDLFHITTREGHEFAMKPMNCPHHTQIYAHLPRSYRDLPQRYSETTMVYRDEQSGEMHGLSRVRCITQDDAHVFCRESQLKDEFYAIWDIIEEFYKKCGFPELKVRLSLSDPEKQANYLGTREEWDKSEAQLRAFIAERGAEYFSARGEAAFYGPKIDFMTRDSLGREWQVATIQADRSMPKSFNLTCTNEDGEAEQVVMIHAAIMGSIERFLSILIEHTAGKFPLWLAPVQVIVLPIADRHHEYAREIVEELKIKSIRVELDDASESLNKKIRRAQKQQIPYMLIIGDEEVEAKKVAVRSRDEGDLGTKKLEEVIELIK